MENKGVISMGLKCPIIREGDPLIKIVVDAVLESGVELNDRDVLGVTESVVARAYGCYVTVDEIAGDIIEKFGENAEITLLKPIYSRNRFSMILKGIARASRKINFVMPPFDEVGNPYGVNPFTGVNIAEYYKEICENEGCEAAFMANTLILTDELLFGPNFIHCGLHNVKDECTSYERLGYKVFALTDLCGRKNPDYGLLGSNKATEEKLKLFPTRKTAQAFVTMVQKVIFDHTGKWIEVMVYGDGCFKDPVGGIWEFADPVVSPGYTDGLRGTPNEIKIKAFADDQFANLSGEDLDKAIKMKIKVKDAGGSLVGNMAAQGTTPRRYVDLLGSLMDLTSGSGDKGTPIVLVQNYFNNFATC